MRPASRCCAYCDGRCRDDAEEAPDGAAVLQRDRRGVVRLCASQAGLYDGGHFYEQRGRDGWNRLYGLRAGLCACRDPDGWSRLCDSWAGLYA